MIKQMAFVVYPVSDLERAKAFYRDKLELGEPRMLHDSWAEFDVGGTTLAIVKGGEAIGVSPGSAFSVAFETDDLDGTITRLKDKGVALEAPFDSPTCRACFGKDPDGNRFALHQLKR